MTSTDDQCTLNGAVYDRVPVVMSRLHHPVDAVNSFIRASIRGRRQVQASAVQKAHTLTNLCTFIEQDESTRARCERRRPDRDVRNLLHSIDDDQLERWRNRDEKAGLRPRVINTKLSVAFHFLLHCSKIPGLPNRIADVEVHADAPVKIWREKRRYHTVILSNLLYRGAKTKSRMKGVPSLDEMTDAYVRASEGRWDLASRDVLILNVAEDASLRLSEALSLRVSQLPDLDEVASAEAEGRAIILKVMRKGGAEHDVSFPATLLRGLHDYVSDVRPEFFSKSYSSKSHDIIFVSHNTGRPLNRQYMSRRLSSMFRDAKPERRLTYHRVRARFATVTVSVLVDAEIERAGGIGNIREENILLTAMEMMGQSSIESLRPYLQLELQARFSLAT